MTSILVVDDVPSVRRLLRMILEPAYDVIEAGDGNEALRQLIDHRPDVVILDVAMPARNGIEVCRELRQDPRLTGTAVIVVTANGAPTDRSVALDAGADSFLTKPFSPGEIVRLVEDVLRARTSVAC